MIILLAHNYYQIAGGEDGVFEQEGQVLEGLGHKVFRYSVRNPAYRGRQALAAARTSFWNPQSFQEIGDLVRRHQIELVHFHNTFPQISPSGYEGARAAGAAVVHTLHNYRLTCVNALLFRDGKPCELCVGRSFAAPGVRYRCYRGSRAASLISASVHAYHRRRGTFSKSVDRYIALTEFAKGIMVRAGLPEAKVAVKPNLLAKDPGVGEHGGGYALFVGRLSEEKGLELLIEAWKVLQGKFELRIIGEGPSQGLVEQAAATVPGVSYLGKQPKDEVLRLMKDAAVLMVASVWYEGCPMVLVEAAAVGLPVVASNHGAMATMIRDGETGLHFHPGDRDSLAATVERALGGGSDLLTMGRRHREEFDAHYAPEANSRALLDIYEAAIRQRNATSA